MELQKKQVLFLCSVFDCSFCWVMFAILPRLSDLWLHGCLVPAAIA